ncbi:MAG: hypothetical protein NVS3B7_16840 [Candidatus Elarobacter sp.]
MIAPTAVDVLHRPVAALVRTYGAPQSVASRDDGQRFVFGDATSTFTAVVDDDAIVHAVDVALPPGTVYSVDVQGTSHRFTFGTTTSLNARDELAVDAETEGGDFRVFRRGPGSDVVLVFDAATSRLTHVIVGDRATVMRLGYLKDPLQTQVAFPYAAPSLRRSAVADGAGAKATVLRLDLDRRGSVTRVAVVVPSDDVAFDTQVAAKVAHDAYAPAKLGGRTIGASVYREVRH